MLKQGGSRAVAQGTKRGLKYRNNPRSSQTRHTITDKIRTKGDEKDKKRASSGWSGQSWVGWACPGGGFRKL